MRSIWNIMSDTADAEGKYVMEQDMRACPMRIEKLQIARGHIILWLEKNEPAEKADKTEPPFPRFVYISGELTLNGKFYLDSNREWYWVEKPEGAVYFLHNLTVLGTVSDDDRLQIVRAAEERNKANSENVQIIYEPVESPKVTQPAEKASQQETEDYPQVEYRRKGEYFYGISRVFSTKNEEQYQTIGAFWDEMAAKYGLENLMGVGYSWTGDALSYAIGLKEGTIEDYDVQIWLQEDGWKKVKGRTENLGKIYDSIYRDGSLTCEIETFTSDGECEVSFYRLGDAWLEGNFFIKGFVFDTVQCSAYYRPKEPERIVLASNFRYTKNSTIHWWDEASYGMCTHPCTKEETCELYHILKEVPPELWRFTGALDHVPVTEEIRQKALEILRDYCDSVRSS